MKKQLVLDMFEKTMTTYKKEDILENVRGLMSMHKSGQLGGEVMPEDAKPSKIKKNSLENYLFLTLPMALNYQRNSYKLWECAAKAYLDHETSSLFNPLEVVNMDFAMLQRLLVKHKVALQPTKHTEIWSKLCATFVDLFEGDVRKLFTSNNNDVLKIREFIQVKNKSRFPYLSGDKIFNYWLYVIESYTPTRFTNREEITVAPDTHIIQASIKLRIVEGDYEQLSQNRKLLSEPWKKALEDTDISPIDIHTPLWLWSKRGFPKITIS